MTPEMLAQLFEYDRYANGLVIDAAQQISAGELTGPNSPSRESAWKLLLHMLASQRFFLALARGQTVENDPPPDDLADLRERWAALSAQTIAYVGSLDGAALAEVLSVPIGKQELRLSRWQLLAQLLFHAADHRGELSIVLTQLGQPVATLDPILFFVQQSGQSWRV